MLKAVGSGRAVVVLLTCRAVDCLPDQVGVPVVAGPFLYEVKVDRADRPCLAAPVEGVVQVVPRSDGVYRIPLVNQLSVVLGGMIGIECIPLLVVEMEVWDVLASDPVSPPVAFHLCHVAHDAEQGQVRGGEYATGQLWTGQAGSLHQEGLAVPGDERFHGLPFGQVENEPLPCYERGCPRHGLILAQAAGAGLNDWASNWVGWLPEPRNSVRDSALPLPTCRR